MAVGIVYQEIKANPDNVELQLAYKKIKKSDQPLQKSQALGLNENPGLTSGAVDLKNLDKFQATLDDNQIRVVSVKHLNAIVTTENVTVVISFFLTLTRNETWYET